MNFDVQSSAGVILCDRRGGRVLWYNVDTKYDIWLTSWYPPQPGSRILYLVLCGCAGAALRIGVAQTRNLVAFSLYVTLFLSVRSYICTFVRLCGFIWALVLSFYVMFFLRNAMFYLFLFTSFGVFCFVISGINARSKMLRLCHLG